MSKIYDGFTFFNEFDLLEIRLNELWKVVDRFILVQADRTFRGELKPFYLDETPRGREILNKYGKKIRRVEETLSLSNDPWEMERQNRNAIGAGLYDAKPGDLLIISDVDEIPRATAITRAEEWKLDRVIALSMGFYYYKFNRRNLVQNWDVPKMVRVGAMDREINDYRKSVQNSFLLENAGWHFSKCYPKEQIIEMIQAFSHSEYANAEDISKMDEYIATGLHHGNHWQQFDIVPMEGHPKWFLDNIERFKPLIA